MALAKVLRTRRHALGISQEAFAEKVDLSKNYVGNLERGEYEPSIGILMSIAHQFGLKASDLIKEAGL
jgi:transcriptional regulator with XRE-family HTH domain